MDITSEPFVELTEPQCWDLLRSGELGRLVTWVGGYGDIVPINYVAHEGGILMRTGSGSKLLELTINDEVLFEADDYDDDQAWSVVMRGVARRLEKSDEIARADAAGLRPWVATIKTTYVLVTPRQITGRRFWLVDEEERESIATSI